MPSTLAILGGRIIDPALDRDEVGDIFIANGRVVERADKVVQRIDARGKVVVPGLIDMHVHLREPGREEAETIASGCAAALAGGFTSICCMPNTTPALDEAEIVREVQRRARLADGPNVFVIAAITRGREGKRLVDFRSLAEAGVVGFSDDGNGLESADLMARALSAAAEVGRPIISHCEVADLAAGGVMHDGDMAKKLGVPGIPGEAEERMLARDVALAQQTGGALHLAHVSTARSVEILRDARAKCPRITAEVTPHHLLLTHEALSGGDANFKMNPPLRTRQDADALIAALADGTINAIATDHAPHTPAEKARGLLRAPFGVIGMESALPVLWTHLVQKGVLSPTQLIYALSTSPAQILKLNDKGYLAPGADADVTIIDPRVRWRIDASQFRSKSRNCPFNGWEVTGKVVVTIVAGRVKLQV